MSLIHERAAREPREQQLEKALKHAIQALRVARRALERSDAGQIWLNAPHKPERTPLTEVSRALKHIRHAAPDVVEQARA